MNAVKISQLPTTETVNDATTFLVVHNGVTMGLKKFLTLVQGFGGSIYGTWTPIIAGIAVAGAHTYTLQKGHYVRTGKHVTAWFDVTLASLNPAMDGLMAIAGIPFVNGPGQGSMVVSVYSGIAGPAGYVQIGGFLNPGDAFALPFCFGPNVSPLPLTRGSLSANTVINGSLHYVTR